MTFTSLTFLVFLPAVFVLYWALGRRRAQNAIVVAASYFFYGWWDWRYCGLMLASSLVDWGIGLALGATEDPRRRKGLLAFSVVVNLGFLGSFKYFDFFAENLLLALSSLGWHTDFAPLRLLLPVGISFYTFQSLSYTIDVYRRDLPPARDVIEFLAFVSFFPQLVAGPIERATHLLPQFQRERTFDEARARDGCRRMLWGFVKKMAVADNLGVVADAAYAVPAGATGPELLVGTLAFGLQIYCDFSAYSDIATGAAALFGIELSRNFALPYFSQSVTEFWRRWHISLSTWLRDYVYLPLGGGRAGAARKALNILVTFVLSGLWHGAAWTYVVWGALHGVAVAVSSWRRRDALKATDLPGGPGELPTARALLAMLGTFAFVQLTWVFFRARSLEDALLILGRIGAQGLDLERWGLLPDLPRKAFAAALVLALVLFEWARRDRPHPLAHGPGGGGPLVARWSLYTALAWLAFLMAPPRQSPFIYFQF